MFQGSFVACRQHAVFPHFLITLFRHYVISAIVDIQE